MSDTLSQKEIDELLSAVTSEQGKSSKPADSDEGKTKGVKPYDFRAANKFSKEQMRTMHFIYDNYSSRLSTYLSGKLRTICDVDVVSIEEQTFAEFSSAMPAPVIVSIINMRPLQESALFEISPVISYEIISRLLGGSGQYQNTDKTFTEIELSIMERVIKQILSLMDEAWERINKIAVSLDRIETNSQYAQIVAANEPMAIITMNVQIGEVSDVIKLCIPHVTVQPISKKLVMKSWYSDNRTNTGSKNDRKKLSLSLANVYLDLHAVFDETQATVSEILGTQIGDVIQIDHNINRQITIKVEHIPKFKGFIGMQGSNYAVQVTDILKEENDNEYTGT